MKGFTLIETLVSLIILTFCLSVASISYNLYINSWLKLDESRSNSVTFNEDFQNLSKVLTGVYPHNVLLNVKRAAPYFYGGSDVVEFSSIRSLFGFDGPVAVRISIIKEEDLFALIYQELDINNVNFKYLSDLNWEKAREKRLFNQVESVLLNYYGYQELDDVYNLDKKPTPRLSNTYDSFQTNVLPIYFQLEIVFGRRNIIIDSGDIPVNSVAYSMVSQGL